MSGQQTLLVDQVGNLKNSAVKGLTNRSNIDQFSDDDVTIYISSQTVLLSSSQLNAIANIVNSFSRPQITITPSLNIAVRGVLINEDLDLTNYLLKNGLSVSNEEGVYTTAPINDSLLDYASDNASIDNAGINKTQNNATQFVNDAEIEAMTLLTGKWTQKKLRGLAALIQLENLSGVHLLSPTEFLFEFRSSGRIDVLRHGLVELGFTIKD